MATYGPNSPGTVTDATGSGGTIAWTNPGNAAASDNAYATATYTLSGAQQSHWLKAVGFGFAVPADVDVLGVTVEIERSTAGAASIHHDFKLFLVRAGTVEAVGNHADTASTWPTTDTYASYGGAADLWSAAWVPADINNANFGVAFSTQVTGSSNISSLVDHIRVTVTTTAVPPAMSGGQMGALGVGS